jgi:hypothetical protein
MSMMSHSLTDVLQREARQTCWGGVMSLSLTKMPVSLQKGTQHTSPAHSPRRLSPETQARPQAPHTHHELSFFFVQKGRG